MTPIRAVLFDWGDTLFASPDAAHVIVEAAREQGRSVPYEDARVLWEEIWAAGKTPTELARGRDLSPDLHRGAWTALFERAHRLAPGIAPLIYERVMSADRWVAYGDTAPTLRALRARGLKVGVVSNVPRDLAPIFAAAGLGGLVDAFTHSYEVGAEKPDPRIFLAACARLDVAPEDTLMVGDHEVADGGALAAGLSFLHLEGAAAPGASRGLERVLAVVDGMASAVHLHRGAEKEGSMEERTTVEKRTTVIPDPTQTGSTNVNVDPDTGDTEVQRNEPGGTTVRETTVEKTTRG